VKVCMRVQWPAGSLTACVDTGRCVLLITVRAILTAATATVRVRLDEHDDDCTCAGDIIHARGLLKD